MPLVVNGTTIPENVANAFSFNGTNVTDVYFNGVQVWHQSLFNRIWSGSSFSSNNFIGMETSGSLFRQAGGMSGAGAWVDVDLSGNFSGDSFDSNSRGFDTSANLIRSRDSGYYGAWATFIPGTGFSGGGISGLMGFLTSGGSCRTYYNGAYGTWISLT